MYWKSSRVKFTEKMSKSGPSGPEER